MRRLIAGFSILALVAVVSVKSFSQDSVTGSTIEKTLIDFNTFEQNIAQVVENDDVIHEQALEENEELNLTAYGYYDVDLEAADWALSNWNVELASSADTINNNIYSYCKSVENTQNDETTVVLGVRVHFPEWKFLSWALVQPPFEIFPQYDNGSYINDPTPQDEIDDYNDDDLTVGLLVNVGLIESISVQAYGLNYTHQVGIRLKNRDSEVQEYFMGSLYYHRWRKLVWMNPDYASDPRDRDPVKMPLYPQAYPFVKFDSLVIYKPTTDDGGNFVTYFKDIKINFERAVLEEEEYIDHEDVWNILSDEQMERRVSELKQISEEIYLREQVIKRMSTGDEE